MVRRRVLLAGAAVAAVEPRAARSHAMPWLMQPVRLAMPASTPGSTPSSTMDRAARLLLKDGQQHLGLPLIIENPPGAGTPMGSAQATSLRPPSFPDLGPCREPGRGPDGTAWFGLSAPAGVSRAIVVRLTGPAGRGVVAAKPVQTGNRIIPALHEYTVVPALRADTATQALRALGTREPRRVAI